MPTSDQQATPPQSIPTPPYSPHLSGFTSSLPPSRLPSLSPKNPYIPSASSSEKIFDSLQPSRTPSLAPSHSVESFASFNSLVKMATMPNRKKREAPSFDPLNPRSLGRYFEDLENWFETCNVETEISKKRYARMYIPVEEEELWESVPEFADVTRTYLVYKAAIIALYPGATAPRKLTLANLEDLIFKKAKQGIRMEEHLGSYFRDFSKIAVLLVANRSLSDGEQNRYYLKGFSADQQRRIDQHLYLKNPNHDPSTHHTFTDVHEAAQYALKCATANLSSNLLSKEPAIKQEELPTSILESLSRTLSILTPALAAFQQGQPFTASARPQIPLVPLTQRPAGCIYCGELTHSIGKCQRVDEDIQIGRCQRNAQGRVVLPSGSFVANNTPGVNMREWIITWHIQNPGQLVAPPQNAIMVPQLMLEVMNQNPIQTYRFTADERILALEKEISALRASGEFQVRRSQRLNQQDKKGQLPQSVDTSKNRADVEKPSQRLTPPQPPPIKSASPSSSHSKIDTPFHPFALAKEIRFSLPSDSMPSQERTAKDGNSGLGTQDPSIINTVFNRSFKAPFVTVTPEELFAISGSVRTKYQEALTPKRSAAVEAPRRTYVQEEGEDEEDGEENEPTNDKSNISAFSELPLCSPSDTKYTEIITGTYIVPDTFKTYYRALNPGQQPDNKYLTVAKESHSIRSIMAFVDNTEQVECIIDPGSQIIAMSEEVCNALHLSYDSSVRLNMQSANKTMDQSLGLAHNIPFRFGDIIFYLQAHVIREVAYNILLGRPFDVLTESLVKNYSNEQQTITIYCPNTNQTATIPMISRGPPCFL